MKYNHDVKYNGVYYPAGTDVPNEETNGGGKKAPSVDVSGKVEIKNIDSSKKYSEEDLNLPYMKLKALAKKEGFKVSNTAKAEEIKDMLRAL